MDSVVVTYSSCNIEKAWPISCPIVTINSSVSAGFPLATQMDPYPWP